MLGGRTPLSARWKQMSQQEQLIQQKKELLQQKNKEKSENKTVNIFTNDGSFLEKFKMMKDADKKPAPPKPNVQEETKTKPVEPKISHNEEKYKNTSRHRRRTRSRSSSRSSSRSRSRSRSRDRGHRSQDRWKRNDRSREKHKTHGRWEATGRHSRRRSTSPCTPSVEDMIQRKQSRFSSSIPTTTSTISMTPSNMMPNMSMPPVSFMQNNPPPNFQPGPIPSLMSMPPVQPPMGLPPPGVSVPSMLNPPPLNVPPGPVPPLNVPLGPVPSINMSLGPVPPVNIPPPGPIIPPHNMSSGGSVVPPLNMPPPPLQPNFNMPPFPSNPPLPLGMSGNQFNHSNFVNPPPGFGDNSFYSMPPNLNMIPPPTTMPLHTIPEPKPLEAMSIPPPKPMNLQSIPPPSPICINQIPKPKELDLHSIPPPTSLVLSTDDRRLITPTMDGIAKQVAQSGDELEAVLKGQSSHDSSTWFLNDVHNPEYKLYRNLVEKYRCEIEEKKRESQVRPEDKYEPEFSLQDDSDYEDNFYKDNSVKEKFEKKDTESERTKKRKSRWSEAPAEPTSSAVLPIPGVVNVTNLGGIVSMQLPQVQEKAQISKMSRTDPRLLHYAIMNYGSSTLTEEQWKKCEDHYKINVLYQDMIKKRQEIEKLAAAGRFKYEYDSDEEIDDKGTWEHKLRLQEMEATQQWATELNRQAQGKHHIGDFLPPDELEKFMQKYSAVKGGKEPDLSDYKEFKLKEDNIGFKMLQKLGWSEGQGLGAAGTGIVEPVNKGMQRDTNQGLGSDRSDNLEKDDDEFDAYRKRMMLAYRFRPNPLNNPRRPYY